MYTWANKIGQHPNPLWRQSCLITPTAIVMIYRFLPNSDWRFDNLFGSHLQTQSELFHVSWWYYTLVIDLIGRLHWQTTPITSRRNWPIRSITRVNYHQLTCYNSLWLWRRLPHRLSKRQSLSTTTAWFRTTFPRTIKLNLLLKWLLGSNLSQK